MWILAIINHLLQLLQSRLTVSQFRIPNIWTYTRESKETKLHMRQFEF